MPRLTKGQRHPGAGRKKGQPNKNTLDVMQKCKELGVDPLEIMLRFAAGDWKGLGYKEEKRVVGIGPKGLLIEDYVIDAGLRQKSAKDVSEYLYAKRKAVEHSGEDGEPLKKVVVYETVWRDQPDEPKGDT
jgi:hypothetical protein